MDYCTVDDIQTHTSTSTLIQLTRDDGCDEIDRVVAEEAIIYSSALINGYLRGRYSLPLDTHFPLLKNIAVDLCVYRLFSRRMRNDMPEVISDNYKNAIKTLTDLQKGVITLKDDTNNSSYQYQTNDYTGNKTFQDRVFNKKVLSEY